MGLSQPLLARGVGLVMQMAGTVLAVQAMPVEEVATYFAIVAAANLISALSDFGFCQYAFRYINRGVSLHRVFAAALTINVGGCLVCLVFGAATAVIMHLPPLLLFAAIAGSALHKLTSLNASVELVRHRVTLAVSIAGLQPTFFVLLMLAYAVLVPGAWSGRGTIDIVGSIYPASFAMAFPITVMLCRLAPEWREALKQPRTLRRRDVRAFVRGVRRSILLAVEWNLTSLWASFLVLWFNSAGYSYETAVLGVLQRTLTIPRAATAVSLQVRLTYYYNAAVSSSYLLKLAKQGLLIGCGVAAVAFAGGWAIAIGRPLLVRLPIAEMFSELAQYWLVLGVICSVDYLFFHFSFFALGLNQKLIRVAAPAAGLAVLLGTGLGAHWLEPHDRIGYALLAYAISLSIANAILLVFLTRLQTRRPVRLLLRHDPLRHDPLLGRRWHGEAHLAIRKFHKRFFERELGERLAIYFHEVLPAEYNLFRELVSFFKTAGYLFVDAAGVCAAGPGKRVFISFDDNYRSWLHLLKVLDECDIAVTFFVNTSAFRDVADRTSINGYFDRIEHHGERISLSTTELCELAAAGHRIGCHSHSHFDLTTLAGPSLECELDRSKATIEEIIGRQVVDFAYPFGMRRHFSRSLRAYCLDLGFQTISSSIPGLQFVPHRLPSINRTMWILKEELAYNIDNLRVDGRIFEGLTGRSPIG